MEVVQEVEHDMLTYIFTVLSMDERKRLHNGADILNSLSIDAEEELKERSWELVKQNVCYKFLIEKVKEHIRKEEEEEEPEEEEEEPEE